MTSPHCSPVHRASPLLPTNGAARASASSGCAPAAQQCPALRGDQMACRARAEQDPAHHVACMASRRPHTSHIRPGRHGLAAALREQINAQAPDDAAKVSFNDLIIKAAALALREYPNLNASLENDQLVEHPNIDINVAVAIEGGLIAPFVPDADQKG